MVNNIKLLIITICTVFHIISNCQSSYQNIGIAFLGKSEINDIELEYFWNRLTNVMLKDTSIFKLLPSGDYVFLRNLYDAHNYYTKEKMEELSEQIRFKYQVSKIITIDIKKSTDVRLIEINKYNLIDVQKSSFQYLKYNDFLELFNRSIFLEIQELIRSESPEITPNSSLFIESHPSGAQIYINGELEHRLTPCSVLVNQSKHIFIRIQKGEKLYFVNSIDSLSEIDSLYVELKNPGSIYIDSYPRNTKVFIDSFCFGNSPIIIKGLSPGLHDILLNHSSYSKLDTSIYLKNIFENKVQKYKLDPLKSPITIHGFPENSKIYLDDQYLGRSPIANTNVIFGSRNIEICHPGFFSQEQKISINDNFPKNFSYMLTPVSESKSLILSGIYPGIGHLYANRLGIGLAFISTTALSIGGVLINHNKYSDSVDKIDDLKIKLSQATDPELIQILNESISEYELKKNTFKKFQTGFLILTAGIWVANLIELKLFFNRLPIKLDYISQRLSSFKIQYQFEF